MGKSGISFRFWGPAGGAVNRGVAANVGQIGMINVLKELGGGRQPRGGQTAWLGESLCWVLYGSIRRPGPRQVDAGLLLLESTGRRRPKACLVGGSRS